MQHDGDDTVHRIAPEEQARLLEAYTPFILKTASLTLKRYVTRSDDAWSVALIAFWEALRGYDGRSSRFETYAQLVIRRRLIDEQRRQCRFGHEIDVAPEVFTADLDAEDLPACPLPSPLKQSAVPASDALADEILEASRVFLSYGFTFADLVACSPKSAKTRESCARAAACLLASDDLLDRLYACRQLPVQAIAQRTGLSIKLLNRHRRYIIAVVEILKGDFPGLAVYLKTVKTEGVNA